MGILSKNLGRLALIAITFSPVAYILGGVTLDACNGVLLAATGVWFTAATISFDTKPSAKTNESRQTA